MHAPRRTAVLVVAAVLVVTSAGCLGPALDGGDGGGGSEGNTTAADGDGGNEGNATTAGEGEESEGNASEANADDGNATATFLADGGNATVTLEVAATREEQEEGLMHRESLPDDHGMVFVYDDAAPRSFWMKNTYVPLDMIFVAPNGTVLNVEHAAPQPNAAEEDLVRYESDGPAQYVIELERGYANETGVEVGTEVVLRDLDEREE